MSTPLTEGYEYPQATSDPYYGLYYMRLEAGRIARTIEHTDRIIADYDEDGELLGIEILGRPQGDPSSK